MSLTSFSVRRPVAATMFYLGVVLLGLISWYFIPRELFPGISFPQLLIVTRYGNAAPEEIENLITKVIEESVGTVKDLKRVRSLSKEGISLVTLEFDWGADMGFAHLAAREKIDQIKDRLPTEAEEPIINRLAPFSQPMMVFSVSGLASSVELMQSARAVKQGLEKISGVASAVISGGREREILVEVDQGRMEASGVSLTHLADTLRDTNLSYPAGTTEGKFYQYILTTDGTWKTVQEIPGTPIKGGRSRDRGRSREEEGSENSGDAARSLLRLRDMAEVKDTLKEITSHSRHNGRDTISISIQKQADANALDTARRVRGAVEPIQGSLPSNEKLETIYDETSYISDAVNGVTLDAARGGILAFMVLYFFLRSLGAAFIVSLAIPAATLMTFAGMYFRDISINLLSLAGLGLGIGNMVDNSIVVAENISRHKLEYGKSPADAAIDGSEEVAASMVTSSFTNVAVLVPLLGAKGLAQQIFQDMFFIVTCASFASVFISITLVPLLMGHSVSWRGVKEFFHKRFRGGLPAEASAAYSHETEQSARKGFLKSITEGISDESFFKFTEKYQKALVWVLTRPRRTMSVVMILGVLSLAVLGAREKVFMPKFDQGQFLLKVQLPVGARLEITDRVAGRIEGLLSGMEGVKSVTSSVGSSNPDSVDALGSHQAQIYVDVDRAVSSTEDVIEKLRKKISEENLEGAEIQYILQNSVLASLFETSAPIVIEVKGPDLATLKSLSEEIQGKIQSVKGIYGVKSSLALPSKENRLDIDKDRASAYGLSVADIARTGLIAVKGYVATKYKEKGQEVDVRVQLRPEDRNNVDSIKNITVQTPGGAVIPLSDIATFYTGNGPSEIKRLDQQRAVVISANVIKRSTSDAIEDVAAVLREYENQRVKDYTVTLSGESRQIKESFGGLAVALVLAVLLIYGVMAADFENYGHPLIIMVTIPLSLIGVSWSLFLRHIPLSAPAILGTILLSGSVVNYGIVLIDFMKQLRAEGRDVWETVILAGTTRLRPILMSGLTTMLAVLPLAAGFSKGSELSSPMAVVTFGGLFVSILLSLFLIPLIYYYFEEWRLSLTEKTSDSDGAAPSK